MKPYSAEEIARLRSCIMQEVANEDRNYWNCDHLRAEVEDRIRTAMAGGIDALNYPMPIGRCFISGFNAP